ncbi:F-box protein [Candidatus Paracaedibacter symbiosus]|uniref:F-box protein n=1 Tax=Candidatus Paracaedibacter symbiosus TaxID=244582 RepID=UPI000509F765|nr:F-box protein [Candidatus Paracaedibacter symbiosus]
MKIRKFLPLAILLSTHAGFSMDVGPQLVLPDGFRVSLLRDTQIEREIQQDVQNHPSNTLLGLPSEVLLHTLSFLPTQDYMQTSQTSRKLYWASCDKYGVIAHLKMAVNAIDPYGTKAQEISQDFNNLWRTDIQTSTDEGDIQEIETFVDKHKNHIEKLRQEVDYHSNRLKGKPRLSTINMATSLNFDFIIRYDLPSLSQTGNKIIIKLIRLFKEYYLPNQEAAEPHLLQVAEYVKPIIPNLSEGKLTQLTSGRHLRKAVRQVNQYPLHLKPFYMPTTINVSTYTITTQQLQTFLLPGSIQTIDEDEVPNLPPPVEDDEGSQ